MTPRGFKQSLCHLCPDIRGQNGNQRECSHINLARTDEFAFNERVNVPVIPKVVRPHTVQRVFRPTMATNVSHTKPSSGYKLASLNQQFPCSQVVYGPAANYKCSLCDQCFSSSNELLQHEDEHLERPFACEICKKRFKEKKHWKRHLGTHSDEKNFSCNICNKSFRRKDNMMSHRRSHTAQPHLYCTICKRQFRTDSSLSKHRNIHHNL